MEYRILNLDKPHFKIIDFLEIEGNVQLIGGWLLKYNVKNMSESAKRKLANRRS